ncbi:hypothetical protein B1T47_03240 [Mycobacterium kansasii]|uniref:hypothetical protein n=1 Tax=Mycobacterium kansasii TaxID=1768 RepID=UPI0009EF77A7|nr:hypothetical protein [Mycobacterium kansasii]ARG68213.1 hypothetical protein B1T47_03240 [Mycobacterium kansasii]
MSGVTIDFVEESGDGTRRIIVWGHDHGDNLDSDQARQLAAELLAAAHTLRRIIVWGHDHGDNLDSDQARQLAAELLAAAHTLDDDQPIPAIYAHTSRPQRAQLHAQLDDDANRETDGVK